MSLETPVSLSSDAAAFLALHQPGTPGVFPTVWDPWSAQLAVDSGFVALTVGSHPVATALGRADNEGMTLEEMLEQVDLITAAVDVPVSADLESGYGASADRIIDRLVAAGAVGLNIEDTVHSEGGRLRSTTEHAELIGRLRKAADRHDVHVVINARTDILLKGVGDPAGRVDAAIEKLRAAADAGADVLYPVGVHDEETHRRLTSELPLPVNAIARPGIDDLTHLAGLGVARISFGPHWQKAVGAAAAELLAPWRTA